MNTPKPNSSIFYLTDFFSSSNTTTTYIPKKPSHSPGSRISPWADFYLRKENTKRRLVTSREGHSLNRKDKESILWSCPGPTPFRTATCLAKWFKSQRLRLFLSTQLRKSSPLLTLQMPCAPTPKTHGVHVLRTFEPNFSNVEFHIGRARKS